MNKPPFLTFLNLLSPLECESIIDRVRIDFPNIIGEKVDKSVSFNPLNELRISQKLKDYVIPECEKYFEFEHKGTFPIAHEWYPTNCTAQKPICESSEFVRGKWYKVRDYDFTGIIFLSDYNDKPPFDSEFEVYGGQLEFLNFKFKFNPLRGTGIFFPSCSNFINYTSPVMAGDLYQLRINFAASVPYVYDNSKYKFNVQEYINDISEKAKTLKY